MGADSVLKRLCAWCGRPLCARTTGEATHGVCPVCKANLMPLFLDTLDGPVLLCGDDARVLSANALARALARKELAQVEGRLFGEVFGCRYSALPGGCGKTPHCPTCGLRPAIEETYATGVSRAGVKGLLRLPSGDVPVTVSTRKVKDGVLLRFDEAPPGGT